MIIEEILKQRIEGIKNEKGVYVTPAFPKLIYVLDEHNCLKGGPSSEWCLHISASKHNARRSSKSSQNTSSSPSAIIPIITV